MERRRALHAWLALGVVWGLLATGLADPESGAQSSDGSKAKVAELEAEVQRVSRSLEDALGEKEILASKVSSLKLQLKDAQAIIESGKRDQEAQQREEQAKSTLLQGQLDAAEKRVKNEEALRLKKEEQLQRALKDVQALTDSLKSTEHKLEEESSVVRKITEELPPVAGQAAAAQGPRRGEMLLERVKQTVAHQASLAREVEKLKGTVDATQRKLAESEAQRQKLGKAEAEMRRLERKVEELEEQAAKHKKILDKVSEHWLPPWLVEALESAQDQAQHHWTHTAEPTIKLVRSQSLDALEYTKKQAEPHLLSFAKASKELAQSTRDTLRPHVEVAKQRHQEAMAWLALQSAELQKAAEPHVRTALRTVSDALDKAHEAAAPYLKQASDVVTPYYQEAYAAAKPGLEAMQATAAQYLAAASASLGPQLELLAETSAQYQRQVTGIVGNVTQQVAGTELSPDALLFAEVGLYLGAVLLALLLVLVLVRVSLRGGKDNQAKKGKPKPVAPHHGKKHHQPHHVKKAHEKHHHHK